MLYIEDLYLSGFRTIQDLHTTFKPGLNIIIGKNGTGKSNLLQFISDTLSVSETKLTDFKSSFTLKAVDSNDEWKIRVENTYQFKADNEKQLLKLKDLKIELQKNDVNIITTKDKQDFYATLNENGQYFHCVFIRHGLPSNYILVEEPLKFTIHFTGYYSSLFEIINASQTPFFLKGLFISILIKLYGSKAENTVELYKCLSSELEWLEKLKKTLTNYTNIKDIRLHNEFNVYYDWKIDEYQISNFFLEFYINNEWLPFGSLSDGTKRLFYIISEIATYSGFTFHSNVFGLDEEKPVIILLEEPELGIHPHLLNDLLQFIKESSLEKQIILTTHSPQVLDILEADELDRILISKLENGKTTLTHLTEEQIAKAKDYLESEAYLSDYWKYSDLEE